MKDRCFLIHCQYEVSVVYIHVPGDVVYWNKTKRFVETYNQFPPGMPHRMVVVSQGREPFPDVVKILDGLGDWELFLHDNSAQDIGAWMRYARVCDTPMMVCLSGSTYFRRPGWLKRMHQVFQRYNGVGLFGACGNPGDTGTGCYPHIRTSSFWCNPKLLCAYPEKIFNNSQRYPFEHGRRNFTVWCRGMGLPTVVVDFSNHWEFGNWGRNRRGYRQTDQYDLLVGDRNTEPPDYPNP